MQTQLLLVLAFGLLTSTASAQTTANATTPVPGVLETTEALALLQQARAEAGLPQLTLSAELAAAADEHSQSMAERSTLSHQGSTGEPPSARIARYVSVERFAQTIARGTTAEQAIGQLLGSAPHRAELLQADFDGVGLAARTNASGVFLTVIVARLPRPVAAPALPEASSEIPPPPAVSAPAPAPLVVPQLRVPASPTQVQGYWVQVGQVWWYFPVPMGAAAGSLVPGDPNAGHTPPQAGPRPVRAAQPVRWY